jgi:hypothetical protein
MPRRSLLTDARVSRRRVRESLAPDRKFNRCGWSISPRPAASRASGSGLRRDRHRAGAPRGLFGLRSRRVSRGRRGPLGRCGGTAAHAERPLVFAGRRGGRPHAEVVMPADGRGARVVPRFAGARVDPQHAGHASGSTSKICWRRATHRRLASVGASRGAETMAGGPGPSAVAGAACPRTIDAGMRCEASFARR